MFVSAKLLVMYSKWSTLSTSGTHRPWRVCFGFEMSETVKSTRKFCKKSNQLEEFSPIVILSLCASWKFVSPVIINFSSNVQKLLRPGNFVTYIFCNVVTYSGDISIQLSFWSVRCLSCSVRLLGKNRLTKYCSDCFSFLVLSQVNFQVPCSRGQWYLRATFVIDFFIY